MGRINVSTPRTALLLLILIVGCGLILSLIRMSDMPSNSYYTSSRQYISHILDEAAAQRNTDPLHIDDGPTRFEDDSIIKLYQEDQNRGQHNLPEVSEPSTEPGTIPRTKQAAEQSSEQPTEEQSSEQPTDEQSSEPPTDKESSEPPTEEQQGTGKPTEEQNSEQFIEEQSSEQATEEQSSEPPTDEQQGTEQSTDEQSKAEVGLPTEAAKQSSGGSDLPTETPSSSSSSEVNKPTASPTDTQTESETETNTDAKRTGPVHVLLLTEGRSGSTWLSSFFWHRDEVYYTFEPLYQTPVWKKNGCSTTEEKRKQCDGEVLSHFWKCDFHSSQLSVLGRYPDYHLDCKRSEYRCSRQGKEEMCNAATHRVAKTIRLWDLTHMEDIMKDTSHYDVRVIHLVRDPRPLLKSRAKPGFGSLDGMHRRGDYTEESFEEQCTTVCKRMLDTSELGDNPPDWLKDRYVRITHEQMSLHPIETAKMLYKFVDLSWTTESEEYIYKTTTGEIGKGGMFGIGKVSTKVINGWKMMKEATIEEITRACYKTLKYLDYETDLEKIRQWKLDNADLFTDDELGEVNNDSSNNSNEAR